jgi:hypothetical protein
LLGRTGRYVRSGAANGQDSEGSKNPVTENPVTEHSFPNYFSTIANVFDRTAAHSIVSTLIRHANVEEKREIRETWHEVNNFGITSE